MAYNMQLLNIYYCSVSRFNVTMLSERIIESGNKGIFKGGYYHISNPGQP